MSSNLFFERNSVPFFQGAEARMFSENFSIPTGGFRRRYVYDRAERIQDLIGWHGQHLRSKTQSCTTVMLASKSGADSPTQATMRHPPTTLSECGRMIVASIVVANIDRERETEAGRKNE
jgi:hypothetical protein